jgi:hypothetical protein
MARQEATIEFRDVRTTTTSGGNTRYVVIEESGKEYSTFKEAIGERAKQFVGKCAKIEFHEVQRRESLNVYLDRIERAALEAAPYLVGDT